MTELAAVPSIGRAADVETTADAAGSVALELLYERHSQRVFRFCLAYLRKRDEAEDAAQTTFLHALGALRRGVVPTSESAWLLKIARNVCLTRFDATRRRGQLELVQDPSVLAEVASARPAVEMDVASLQAALEHLPARQRQAILLREWQGLSYAEIAEELGLTTAAVETLLFRARRALAKELGGEEARRGRDLASLLGWAKGLLGGAAVKIAIGAAVVATVGVLAPVPFADRSPHGGRQAPAPAPAPARAGAAPAHAAPSAAQPSVPARTSSRVAVTAVASSVPASTRPLPTATPASPGSAPVPPSRSEPAPSPQAPPAQPVETPAPALPVAPPSLPSIPAATVPTPTLPTPTLPTATLPSLPAPPTVSVTVPSLPQPPPVATTVPDPQLPQLP